MADNERAAQENVAQEAKATPHDVPTVRVRTDDGQYKIINRKDYNEKEHGAIIKGGEDQEQGLFAGASDRNPSGTYSEPTPTDIRYPDKDATEFENNHGAFVNKSAAQMREEKGMEDAPGGLYPAGAMRVEATGTNRFRLMSGQREVMSSLTKVEADKFRSMKSDNERDEWVKSRGGKPPERTKKEEAGTHQPQQPPHPAPAPGQPAAAVPNAPPRR
jgi:hypothetical protein